MLNTSMFSHETEWRQYKHLPSELVIYCYSGVNIQHRRMGTLLMVLMSQLIDSIDYIHHKAQGRLYLSEDTLVSNRGWLYHPRTCALLLHILLYYQAPADGPYHLSGRSEAKIGG
jgi:hypothetical protein